MSKERLSGLNPRNEREALILINQVPQDKKEFIEQDLAIAENIVTAFRAYDYEAKISELAQNLIDQYYGTGNVLLGEQFRQLRRQAPFQWDKFGAINLIVLKATPESIHGQHFEEADPKPYPNPPLGEIGASWEEGQATLEKRNQEIRNWWLNRRIRLFDVREFKQHVRDLAEKRWEEYKKETEEMRVLIGKRGRYTYVAIDWGEASPEEIKKEKFNQLHPRDQKGRFIRK